MRYHRNSLTLGSPCPAGCKKCVVNIFSTRGDLVYHEAVPPTAPSITITSPSLSAGSYVLEVKGLMAHGSALLGRMTFVVMK
jgi:hypothetical protein